MTEEEKEDIGNKIDNEGGIAEAFIKYGLDASFDDILMRAVSDLNTAYYRVANRLDELGIQCY